MSSASFTLSRTSNAACQWANLWHKQAVQRGKLSGYMILKNYNGYQTFFYWCLVFFQIVIKPLRRMLQWIMPHFYTASVCFILCHPWGGSSVSLGKVNFCTCGLQLCTLSWLIRYLHAVNCSSLGQLHAFHPAQPVWLFMVMFKLRQK